MQTKSDRFILTYLAGEDLNATQVDNFIKRCKPKPSPVILYRALVGDCPAFGERVSSSERKIVSMSDTWVAAASAASSYWMDFAENTDKAKNLFVNVVMCEVGSVSVLRSHRSLLRTTAQKALAQNRLRLEREWLCGGTYSGRVICTLTLTEAYELHRELKTLYEK